MRIVPKAAGRPHVCAVFPHLGGDHPKGYFETGNELVAIDPQIYVSVVAAETMARELGWHQPDTIIALSEQITALQAQLEQQTARAEEAEAKLGAIDVIESAGFRARKKPGRKPAEKEAA